MSGGKKSSFRGSLLGSFFSWGGGTCKPQWTSAGEIAAKGEWELPVNMSKPGGFKMSNVQNPVDIPLYWLVNRDPHSGLL